VPSAEHEILIELIRARPALLVEIMPALGLDASATPVIAESSLSELSPAAYSSDLVLHYPAGRQPRAVILEVQRAIKPVKRRRWPHYLTGVRQRLGCDVLLVVIATTEKVARWSAKTIKTGHPGFDLKPIVIGPAQVPIVAEEEQACRYPDLLVLSAIMHGRGPHGEQIAQAARPVLKQLPTDRSLLYFDVIIRSLEGLARASLEKQMKDFLQHRFKSPVARDFQRWSRQLHEEGREEGLQQGRTEAGAKALLAVLATRGIAVPASRADEIRSASPEQLDRWLRRAVTAPSADDLFAEHDVAPS